MIQSVNSIRDSVTVYEILRKAFLLGLRVKPILRALDLRPDESLFDAGCGYGVFLKYIPSADYTGVDSDGGRVTWAKKHLGEHARQKFIEADICETRLPDKSFDKAIGYGLLHHLPDETARRAIQELARLTRKRIVFSDPVYTRFHLINNLLCRLDRGEYVRDAPGYLKLCEPYLRVESARYFYARNGLAKYYLITASPKT